MNPNARLSMLLRNKTLLFFSTILWFILLVFSNANALEIEMANNGVSSYKIVLPTQPTTIQKTAASELQNYFHQITGAKLPIISEETVGFVDVNNISESPLIIIGPGALSQKALGEVDESTIGYDGIILKSVGKSIVLSGSPKRGPIYSVYEFLEKKLGCRWWTSTESTIPKNNVLSITNDLDIYFTPKLEYRESFYRDCFNGPFAVKLKCNGNSENISEEYGGRHVFQFFVHSSFHLIPPQKYYKEHPDWFSEIDGVRKVGIPAWAGQPKDYKDFEALLSPEQIHSSGTQLCFSNDEMIAEMTQNARETLRKNPHASFLSISQNDWHGFCTCEKCKTIDEMEGSHAGSLLRGVNKIAEALEEEFPNLYVETLAYQYTRKPPLITKPRKNVIIRLCSIECSFAQPLESEVNQSFHNDLIGWSKIAGKLFAWDYATNFSFYLLPFPNYRVLAPNINFYVNHKVVGIFEQGDYQCETGDFVQLRNWVVAKLLWDPSLNPQDLINEFISGYYAPDLVPIYREYFDTLSDAVEKNNYYLGIFKTSVSGWLDTKSLIKATKLQNEALKIAKKLEKEDPQKYMGLVSKVRREQIPLDVVWLHEYNHIRTDCRILGLDFVGPTDPLQATRELCAKFDEFGLTKRREGETLEQFNQYKADLYEKFKGYKESLRTPEICEKIPTNSWIELQDFDISKYKIGEWTFMVSDPNASNGKSIKMPGEINEWATSWNVTQYINNLEPIQKQETTANNPQFHVYGYVRCESSVDHGIAMTAGVYDRETKTSLSYKEVMVSDIKGPQFKLLDLGVITLPETSYIWFAPPKRPNEVDSVYIDRIIIIREK